MDRDEDRRRGEGFLSAWSRRKRAALEAEKSSKKAEREPRPERDGTGDGGDAGGAADLPPEATAPEPPFELSEEELAALPREEEITGATDLRPFLRRGVPAAVKKAALRKVWLNNALIRNHDDPAVDYAWDWNSGQGVPGAGGTIAKDRVSKMIDDLINKKRRSADGDVPGDPVAEAGTAAGEPGAAGEAPAGSAEGATDPIRAADFPTDPRRLSDGKSSGRTQDPVEAVAAVESVENVESVETVEDAAAPTASAAADRSAGRARSHGGAIPT